MTWPLTFYVDTLKSGFAGQVNGPIIRILKTYKDDAGIYRHELLHVKQWFATLTFHGLLYALVPRYKLWAEVAAYKEQAKHYPDDRIPLFAGFIANKYGLKITEAEVIKLLRS